MKRVMRKVVFLLLFVFLLSGISAVSPGICGIVARADCDDPATEGYIVMGLSSSTNAHGENYTTTGIYPYVLCCNFGDGVQATECTGTNTIIKLSSITNAHAESPLGTTYLTKVCYEDLVCEHFTSSCPTNYPLGIVSLTSVTNAHIGGINDYTTKICCRSSLFAGCTITSASWNQDGVDPKVYDGTKVYLEVTGSSSADCSGKSVAFNIKGGKDPVTTQSSNVSFTGNTARGSWYSEYQKCGFWPVFWDCSYSFNASLAKNPQVNMLSGEPIPTLTVSERDENFCVNIQSCEDYDNEQDCNSDAGVCNVAKDNKIVKCDDDAIVCSCVWDGAACGFGYTTIGGGDDCDPATEEDCCEPGETLCLDNTCSKECGSFPACDENDICDAGEGCACIDCDGEQDSCDYGSVCSEYFGACTCDYGFTLCRKSSGILYCNLGNTCPAGESPTSLQENQNGSCDFGIDGCLSADCAEGDQDTCFLGTYCMDGKCSSVEAPPVTLGNCKITQVVEQDCEEGGGMKTIRITGTWTGEGTCGEACQKCNALQDKPLTVPCPAQIQLPFFDYIGIITTITAIVIIYVSLILKKKIGKKKK